MFRRLLRKNTIVAGLTAETKEDVFRALLSRTNATTHNKFLEMLLLRESYGTTALGDELALPSVTHAEVAEPSLILGISREGVDFAALNGEPVHFVALLLLPEHMREVKKDIVISMRRHFGDRFYRDQLKAAADADEVMMLLETETAPELSGSTAG